MLALHHGRRHAALGLADRGEIAAGSAADDDQVEAGIRHGWLLSGSGIAPSKTGDAVRRGGACPARRSSRRRNGRGKPRPYSSIAAGKSIRLLTVVSDRKSGVEGKSVSGRGEFHVLKYIT